jgi:hypothetical protein
MSSKGPGMRRARIEAMTTVKQRLLEDHENLNGLLKRLADDTSASDFEALRNTWNDFELALGRHLDAEEAYLFPLLEASHPFEVGATLDEHRRIRKAVAEIGVQLDLHTLRAESVLQLIEQLQQHAIREECTMYRWLDELGSTRRARWVGALRNATRGAQHLLRQVAKQQARPAKSGKAA